MTNAPEWKHSPLIVGIVASTVIVAGIDFWTSAVLVASILFTFPLALCALQPSRRLLWGVAVVVCVLTFAAEFWGANRLGAFDPRDATVNRGLLIASLLTLTTFIHLWINKSQKVLLDAEEIERQSSRLMAQTELFAQTEGRYRGLLEAAPDAMVIIDADGRIVLVNAATTDLFGYSREELIGQTIEILMPEKFRGKHPQHRNEYVQRPRTRSMGQWLELRGLRKDNSEFPVEIMLSPLQSAEGILVTAAIRNIAERKHSEERLLKTVEELKRSNDELEQFAYVASHDLQEPLRMVASYTQLLAKRYKGRLDSDADEFIAYAVEGSNRMQRMIHDLLLYSRAGVCDTAFREISSEHSLKEALANLRAALEESGAVVSHDALPVIAMDNTQLVQVFQNLIGNAIKYRSAEIPHIYVSATNNAERESIFAVRDNGMGIDPQYFDRIFAIFRRLHTPQEFAGTGIGLAICKKILQRLGGRIWVESQLGKGSTFYFSLPEGNKT